MNILYGKSNKKYTKTSKYKQIFKIFQTKSTHWIAPKVKRHKQRKTTFHPKTFQNDLSNTTDGKPTSAKLSHRPQTKNVISHTPPARFVPPPGAIMDVSVPRFIQRVPNISRVFSDVANEGWQLSNAPVLARRRRPCVSRKLRQLKVLSLSRAKT